MSPTSTFDTTNRNRDREGKRSMGASRDFTTGADGGAGTGLLERPRRGAQSTTPTRPSRRVHRPEVPQRRNKRLGSKQVVSYRGRRMGPPRKDPAIFRLAVIAIGMVIAGVAVAMWLSGLSTAQTFKIQQLTVQESQLSNQVETLNRDLENVRSSADVARRANDMNMAVPVQPGVVEVNENGDINEQRPADGATESIIDVNGEPVRPGRASSDPNETSDVSDSLSAVPQGQQNARQSDDEDREGNTDDADAADDAAPAQPLQAPYSN